MENNQEKGQSRYNLNEADFMLLAELQREAFNFRNVKKDFGESLQRWISIRYLLEARFEDKERDKLDEIEKEFYIPIKIPADFDYNKSPRYFNWSKEKTCKYILSQNKQLKYLNNYIKEIRKLIKDYNISMTDLDKKAKLD